MNETEKPFACSEKGCDMRFTNEDHLNWHRKKHDMMLNLGLVKTNEVADQTPTPTRFIRNCEEVGLFQDLQNVNPFDEFFKKAIEVAKTGGALEVPEVNLDDTLHTPHILPHIEENRQKKNTVQVDNNSHSNDFHVLTIDAGNTVSRENVNIKRKIKEVLQNKGKQRNEEENQVKSKISVVSFQSLSAKDTRNTNSDAKDSELIQSIEKIREMNRAAQMRCRKRKQQKLALMEEELEFLREENEKLRTQNQHLTLRLNQFLEKEEIDKLKDNSLTHQLNQHLNSSIETAVPPTRLATKIARAIPILPRQSDKVIKSNTPPLVIQLIPNVSGIVVPLVSTAASDAVKLKTNETVFKKTKRKQFRNIVPKCEPIVIEN